MDGGAGGVFVVDGRVNVGLVLEGSVNGVDDGGGAALDWPGRV